MSFIKICLISAFALLAAAMSAEGKDITYLEMKPDIVIGSSHMCPPRAVDRSSIIQSYLIIAPSLFYCHCPAAAKGTTSAAMSVYTVS